MIDDKLLEVFKQESTCHEFYFRKITIDGEKPIAGAIAESQKEMGAHF